METLTHGFEVEVRGRNAPIDYNKEETIANIKEAIAGYIAALEEDGLPVPIEATGE